MRIAITLNMPEIILMTWIRHGAFSITCATSCRRWRKVV